MEEIDYNTLEVIPEGSLAAKLFQIIDDIDTGTDAYKPEKSPFVDYVYRMIEKKNALVKCDGFKIYRAPKE